jgi:CPA2 family monovalent cation:H+ antiporter-2
MDHMVFEVGLALALVAGAALLSWKLRFSTAPFLIVAGMMVGPHAPHVGMLDLRFTESTPIIAFMGRLGVLFLLFYLGLEFSVGRLVRSGRSIAVGGSIYIGINFTLGLAYPALLGWPLRETLVAAGITTISSSAIVAKVLVDLRRTANPETEMILGIIMFEDVFLAVYLSIVSGLVLSGSTSLSGVLASAGMALAFMLGVLGIGRLAVPWLNRALRINSGEVLLLVVSAALLLVAGAGETIHVAEAIGALLLGLVLAETEHRELFFFGFGLQIDPFALGGAVWITLGAVALTLIGNVAAGMLAGRSAGLSPTASANVGLTVVSRGEFSIVVASLGAAGGLMQVLQPFAALYVLILAILGPLLTRQSHAISRTLFRLAGTRRRQPSTTSKPDR